MKKLKKFKQCVGATNKKDEGGEISVSFISVHGHKIGYYLNIHNLKKEFVSMYWNFPKGIQILTRAQAWTDKWEHRTEDNSCSE